MTNEEMTRLERNLSKSALKAKPLYVRGMVGHLESEQGYFSISVIPVYNPFTQQESQLETVLKQIESFYNDYKTLLNEFNTYKQNINTTIDELKARIDELEKIQTAADSLVIE